MRNIILHGHIFKNAGTSLDWSLTRSFGDAFLDHRDDQAMRRHGGCHLAEVLAENRDLMALSSHHLPRDIPALPGVRLHCIYLLRHPLLRIRSVYDFEREQQADTLGAQAAKRMSFREYVAWRMEPDTPPTIRNFQTLYLSKKKRSRARAARALPQFFDALVYTQSLPVVGIVELYDQSMVLLEEKLRPHLPTLDLAYIPQNVSGNPVAAVDDEQRVALILKELDDLGKSVIDNNSYDLALYQAALETLRAATSRLPGFAEKLAGFRERCQMLRGKQR
ncbi:hypothetical protein Q6D67_12430 [Haliea sp. E1-2-M8]|uniref:hypothetical protein n=1 Tax=Haliea sp. E1-2-M8 TaxID=3064706 RepID=UPI00271C6DF3|nr:hypothetical protein [Haliea sp. E1-2-M8]MDO8862509.1 hypothetical protein [Haliea sp. E1-2-M8]